MKYLSLLLILGCVCAGCVTETRTDADIGPKMAKITDPNPYANYSAAMASDKAHPMAYEWQSQHADEIAAATRPEALAPYVANEASACALLGEVRPAYATDPLVAVRIAALTQLVMVPGCEKAAAARPIWVAALEKTLASATDEYVKIFLARELKLCK